MDKTIRASAGGEAEPDELVGKELDDDDGTDEGRTDADADGGQDCLPGLRREREGRGGERRPTQKNNKGSSLAR